MLLDNASSSRENNFDIVRLFLALLVFYSHSFVIFSGEHSGDFVYRLFNGKIDGGYLAVNIFFFLSGYLIIMSWFNTKNYVSFMLKRVMRIFPGLIGVFIFTIFILFPLLNDEFKINELSFKLILKDIIGMYLHTSTVKDFFNELPLNTINGSLWTLKYEFYCYIMILVLGIFKLLNKKSLTFLFIVVFTIYVLQDSKIIELTRAVAIPRLFTYFLLGCLFYLFRDKIKLSNSLVVVSIFFIILLTYFNLARMAGVLFFGYITLCFVYSDKIKIIISSKIGDISYGVYIYAFLMQQTTLYIFKEIDFILEPLANSNHCKQLISSHSNF